MVIDTLTGAGAHEHVEILGQPSCGRVPVR